MQTWFTGPEANRWRYRVADPGPLPGGRDFVVFADRVSGPGDVDTYEGPVSLKLVRDSSEERADKLKERYGVLRSAPHPNLVRPIEVFRGPGLFHDQPPPADECDGLYAASVWVPGSSLRNAAPLPAPEAITVLLDVAAAVRHLHLECRLVHRDLHPGNVIIRPDGRAVIIDIGAAVPDDVTDTATVAGMLGFIPPERTHGTAGRSGDLWGAAMLFVYALLGHPQGRGTTTELEAELRAALGSTPSRSEIVTLVLRMLETDPAARPVDIQRWAREIARRAERGSTRRHVRIAVVATAAALTTTVSAVALNERTAVIAPKGHVATAAVLAIEMEEGDCDIPFGLAPDAVQLPRRDAPELLERAAGEGCATGPVEYFGEAVIQPVTGDGLDGWVVMSPDGAVVRLSHAEWTSYQEIAGRARPENAITFGGYPVSVTPGEDGGSVVIGLSGNGVIVGRRRDTQSFWIPVQAVEAWRSHPELGYPTSNPYPGPQGVRQDYEHGYLFAPADAVTESLAGAVAVEVHLVADRSEILRDTVDVTGRILRQTTGTAWLVDELGRRRWIEDGETWQCLGGDNAVAADNVPGYAVATFRLGPPATCEDD